MGKKRKGQTAFERIALYQMKPVDSTGKRLREAWATGSSSTAKKSASSDSKIAKKLKPEDFTVCAHCGRKVLRQRLEQHVRYLHPEQQLSSGKRIDYRRLTDEWLAQVKGEVSIVEFLAFARKKGLKGVSINTLRIMLKKLRKQGKLSIVNKRDGQKDLVFRVGKK